MNARALRTLTIAALTLIASSIPSWAAGVITIGTNPPGTLFYAAGAALAKVMTQTTDLQVRSQPFAGSGALLSLVQNNQLDMAVVNVFEMSQAVHGATPYKEKHPDLRVVSSLFRSQVGFLVPDGSPIKTLEEIKGKSIAGGYSAAPIIDLMRQAIMANAGIGDNQVTVVPVPNTVRGGDLMKSHRVDVSFLSVGSAKVSQLAAELGGVRFLSLSDDPAAVARMRKIMPQSSAVLIQPAAHLAGIPKPTRVLGYDVVLVANKDIDPKIVKAAVDTMARQHAALGAALPRFKELTLDQMSGVPNVDYLPAAAQEYKALAAAK
jgi:TRAP transporter TAXI family solute receptor